MASSGCKFRKLQRTGARQWSVTSFGVQSASCEYYFNSSFTKLRCAVQGTRGSVCEDKLSPANLGVQLSLAWVEVMLNPPGVDWRIVNYVHDGYRTLSRYECDIARFKPRSFCSADIGSSSKAVLA